MASMAQAADELVERSRAGDQNAMAIIALIGKQARREGPNKIKAKIAFRLVKQSIQKHKAGDGINANADPMPAPPKPFLEGLTEPGCFYPCLSRILTYRKGIDACIITIANGPPLVDAQIESCLESAKEAKASDAGFRAALKVLRQAKRIQSVRNEKCPIRVYSVEAAWELGE